MDLFMKKFIPLRNSILAKYGEDWCRSNMGTVVPDTKAVPQTCTGFLTNILIVFLLLFTVSISSNYHLKNILLVCKMSLVFS